MIDVYDGTIGQLVDKNKLISEIHKFAINNPEPLNYEIKDNDDVRIIAILGKNSEEERLITFNHPLIIEDRNGQYVLAGDFRLFTKSNVPEDTVNIIDVVNDKYNTQLLINRIIFTKIMLMNNYRIFSGINTNLAESLAGLISTLLFQATMDGDIRDASYLATYIHWFTMESDKDLSYNDVINLLPITIAVRLNRGDLKFYGDKIKELSRDGYKLRSQTLSDLINNIKMLSNSPRADKITLDVISPMLTRVVYSSNSVENAIAMVENKPTFIALTYAALTEGINNKSILRKIIEGRKYITKPKDMVKHIKKIIDDNIEVVKTR